MASIWWRIRQEPHRGGILYRSCKDTSVGILSSSFTDAFSAVPQMRLPAAGSKCCIIVTPLTRGKMATVCKDVVTVTTPGDCVDVLVTDYGIAVNPLRPDIIECLDKAGIRHVTIESLQEKAYELVGEPDPLQWEDQVVAIVEARDGTVLDVVRKIKPYTF